MTRKKDYKKYRMRVRGYFECLERDDVIYIENGIAYKYRADDGSIDCNSHTDEMFNNGDRDYDCSDWEIQCPLYLPNRKYCKYYKPVKKN
jgi:hypothetical protein